MATTHRRAAVALKFAGEDLVASSAGPRKDRSANRLARQGTTSVQQPFPLEIQVPLLAGVAKAAAALHARSDGSTVSVTEGNLLGHSRFAVSIYPEKSAELTGAPTRDLLFAFAILNANLLCRPDHALGTWFDSQRNRHVLDVVVCPKSLETAIRFGIDHRQQAIFDLKEAIEILLVSIPEALVEVRREED